MSTPLSIKDFGIKSIDIYIYQLDNTGRIVACNKNFLSLLNESQRQGLAHRKIWELFKNDIQIAHSIRQSNLQVLLSGYPTMLQELYPNPKRCSIKYIAHKIPLTNSAVIKGLISFSVKSSTYLAASEDIDQLALDHIIANLPGHAYWKNEKGTYLGCNDRQAQNLGLSHGIEVVGKTDFELPWPKLAAEIFRKNDCQVMRSGQPLLAEEPAKIDGRDAIVLSHKIPLKNKMGKTIGILGMSIDITKQKEAEKKLMYAKEKAESASKAKSAFIANMSHDIRTPITGVVGMIQSLLYAAKDTQSALRLATPPSASKQAALLQDLIVRIQSDGDMALGAVDELLQLCNEILEVVRLESGRVEVATEAFALRELIQHNIDLLKPVAADKKLQLSASVDDAIPSYLKGKRQCLDRSLLNIISNALKFTEKGIVNIIVTLANASTTTYTKGDSLTLKIQVKDTGIGIPNDKFGVIFEHFSRLTPSYKGIYKGSGLGLYTVKRYVEAMQGTITLASKEGRGSCFTLTLPFEVDDHNDRVRQSIREPLPITKPTTPSPASAHLVNRSESVKARVLVVEDNPMAAMVVKIALERLQCGVAVAVNGKQGIDKASSEDYDLIFMDVGLPDLSGIEVTKAIRALADPKRSQVPIVALTGHAGDEQRQDCLAAGMNAVLAKPAQPSTLQATLQQWVWQADKTNPASKATSPSLPSTKPSDLAVIDWPGCLSACSGDKAMMDQMLSILCDDLKNTKQVLSHAYAKGDTKALRAELHRCLGGIVYLRLPQLEHALRTFQRAVKAIPQDPKQLEATYQCVEQAIEHYWQALTRLFHEMIVVEK